MIQSFLQYIRYEKNYSSHTVLSYEIDLGQLRDFILTQKGGFDPKKLTSDELREWIIALMDVGEKASSVKRKISAVRSFYKFLNLKNLTDNNPTLKIIAPKVPKPLPKFFYEKDLDNCLEISKNNCNFEGVRNSLIIELIYQTGLRRSEVAGLEDKDVEKIVDEYLTQREAAIDVKDDDGNDFLVYHSYSRKYPEKRMMCIDKLIYDVLTVNIVKSRDSETNKKIKYAIDLDKGIFEYIPEENNALNGEGTEDLRNEYEQDVF